jgi:type IV pilus assembly protein PilV
MCENFFHCRYPARQSGFTLIEVLIAISILAIGLLALAKMQMAATESNATSREMTEAMKIAQQQVEDIMTWPYDDDRLSDGDGENDGCDGLGNYPQDPLEPDDPPDADGKLPDPVIFGTGGQIDVEHAAGDDDSPDTANVYWNVAEDYPTAGTKTIRVIVAWTDDGTPRKVVLETIKADII